MTSLVVVDLTIKDKEKMTKYSSLAGDTIKPFNGHYVHKGKIDVLKGKTEYDTKVIIQFPNTESALSWYNSEAYQEIIPLREDAMECQFHLI